MALSGLDTLPSCVGFVNCRWLVRSGVHGCGEKFILLVTRSSRVLSYEGIGGLNTLGEGGSANGILGIIGSEL